MQIVQPLTAVTVSFLLLAGSAAAQSESLQAQMEQAQARYVEAWVGGDADALASLFTEDAIFWPLSGGSFEGREQIREAVQEGPQPAAAAIRSTHTEQIGDLVFDVGTFTMTLPEPQDKEMSGEYVVVAEETDDGIRIHRLISFQPRRPPEGEQ